MTTLQLTPPEKATGPLAELYQSIEAAFGGVPEGLQLFGVSPTLLQAQWQLLGYFGQHPHLSPAFLAMLRYILSEEGHCKFCIGFNEALLINAGFSKDDLLKARKNPLESPLPARDNALLAFVLRAVKDPHSVGKEAVEDLKKQDWTEQDIFDATAHGAQHQAVDTLFETFDVAPYTTA
jgi:alkylhydroperoxidase family enzyme